MPLGQAYLVYSVTSSEEEPRLTLLYMLRMYSVLRDRYRIVQGVQQKRRSNVKERRGSTAHRPQAQALLLDCCSRAH